MCVCFYICMYRIRLTNHYEFSNTDVRCKNPEVISLDKKCLQLIKLKGWNK